MLREDDNTGATIVDFCGGTGHLALPLALLLPHCKVVVVDIGSRSLQLLHEKALRCSDEMQEDSSMDDAVQRQQDDVTYQEQVERQCAGIPNLYIFHGSIETYPNDFDIGVALHACGEATDVTLRACAHVGANFVVSPCCVGKLHRRRANPYIYHATSGNIPTITYPQSTLVTAHLEEDNMWNNLVKAADYGDFTQVRTPRNATRRTAKALLEMDRLLFMSEAYGYNTALARMDPWESSPKNDILIGWLLADSNESTKSPYHEGTMEADDESNADIELSRHHFFGRVEDEEKDCEQAASKAVDRVDWTWPEEEAVRALLSEFVISEDQEWILPPTDLGPRKRKLVHFVAEEMGLSHWSHGKKYASRTVVVAKK